MESEQVEGLTRPIKEQARLRDRGVVFVVVVPGLG